MSVPDKARSSICCREWDTCSDMLPLNMFIPVCVYVGGLIPLAITTYLSREPECYLKPGHTYYRVATTMIFITFCVQVATEMLTFFIGLLGQSCCYFLCLNFQGIAQLVRV